MNENRADQPGIEVASVVFAAGKGSRMTGYEGNKTLLPLIPGPDFYSGSHPMLLEVLRNLPGGPKGIVVNHCADDVRRATEHLHPQYCHQPETNGTGGAFLAALPFLESLATDAVIITMGDVPLIRPATYRALLAGLDRHALMVLGFKPADKAQYGLLEMDDNRVVSIVEWKYWKEYPPERQESLRFCNAGVYAGRRKLLIEQARQLARSPHVVRKQRNGEWVEIKEYFLTDLVELINKAGETTGLAEAREDEVSGVDNPESLERARERYALLKS